MNRQSSGDTIVQYVIYYLHENNFKKLSERFSKSSERLRSAEDISTWLKSVKSKIGREHYTDLRNSFDNHIKKDVKFEIMDREGIENALDTCKIILNVS